MILITGASGYIGSHFLVEVIKKNIDYLAVDDFSRSDPDTIKKINQITKKKVNFIQGNIGKKRFLQKIFSENNITKVIHFAGLKSINESYEYPLDYYQCNVSNTIQLLNVMRKYNAKKFIFSSSATVYGDCKQQPIPETAEIKSMSVYGSTKIAIERMLSEVASKGIIDVVSLRYFNPVGAHKEKIIYENPFDSPNNLMPRIIRVALGIDEKLEVFGDDYETKDGSGERDYIHILDLINGHFSAIDYILDHKGANVFNLGTGRSTSVFQLIKTFESVNSLKIPYAVSKRRSGDVAKCFADPSLARKKLNWQTEYDLSEMCKDAWLGVKDNGSS